MSGFDRASDGMSASTDPASGEKIRAGPASRRRSGALAILDAFLLALFFTASIGAAVSIGEFEGFAKPASTISMSGPGAGSGSISLRKSLLRRMRAPAIVREACRKAPRKGSRMRMKTLGRTDLRVSELCLGSMTWGSQNTEAEGHAQIDRALDAGLNFIDTAEMYPAAPGPDDPPGKTEAVIGSWFEKSGRRDEVVLATKVIGPGSARSRDGVNPTPPISAESIRIGLEGSLRRLRTDHVDLYQLHWPNRGSYHFRQNWRYDPSGVSREETRAHIEEVLGELQRQIEAGKILHIGLSNETAWGVSQWLDVAEANALPRVATIQNEYSLLCRLYDTDLAELCCAENVDLLPFSPLACGVLSGKYEGGETIPEGSRRTRNAELGGRISPRIWPAAEAYLSIARRHDLDPCQMAIAWCLTRPGMGAPIFGATSITQLETALGAATLKLSEDVLNDIEMAHREHPMPL
ncbi:MAG: aldo/keto reductase [Pseudomonadota bacterium]